MKAQNVNLAALAAAALFTATGLAALHTRVPVAPVSEINGVKVIDLAPVMVRPNAEEVRAAALLTDAGVASAIAVPAMSGSSASNVMRLLGQQLTMPYYSFGTKFARSNKE
jgi:hypothetical protein